MKTFKVWVAILVAVVLVGMVVPAFGQADQSSKSRPVTVDPPTGQTTDQEASGSVQGYNPPPSQPAATTSVAPTESKIVVREGRPGRNGKDGKNGRNGRNGRDATHQGHRDAYRHVKTWGVLAKGGVKLIVDKEMRSHEAKLHSSVSKQGKTNRGAVAPVPKPSPAPAPVGGQPMHPTISGNWPLILLLLALIALVLYGISLLLRYRNAIRNTARGGHFGRRIRQTRVISTPSASPSVDIQKAGVNLHTGSTWIWGRPNFMGVDVPHSAGDELEFIVSVSNNRRLPIRANGITVQDELVNGTAVPGSGRVYAGGQPLGNNGGVLPDAILTQLVTNQPINLGTIVDQVPAADANGVGRINITYRVDTTPAQYQQGAQQNVPLPGGGVGAAPAGPLFLLNPPPAPAPPAPAPGDEAIAAAINAA